MCPIVNIKMIVTVQLQPIKSKHKPLKYGVRLKSDHTVDFLFILAEQHRAIYFPVKLLKKMVFAKRLH